MRARMRKNIMRGGEDRVYIVRSQIMNLCVSICFTLLLCSHAASSNGMCDLDGQWYDSSSTSHNEVSMIPL